MEAEPRIPMCHYLSMPERKVRAVAGRALSLFARRMHFHRSQCKLEIYEETQRSVWTQSSGDTIQ